MDLGALAHEQNRGYQTAYYLEELALIREETFALLKQRDDRWLCEIGPESDNINTYYQWYHVYEDEITIAVRCTGVFRG